MSDYWQNVWNLEKQTKTTSQIVDASNVTDMQRRAKTSMMAGKEGKLSLAGDANIMMSSSPLNQRILWFAVC